MSTTKQTKSKQTENKTQQTENKSRSAKSTKDCK